jgi:hypothetical protein
MQSSSCSGVWVSVGLRSFSGGVGASFRFCGLSSMVPIVRSSVCGCWVMFWLLVLSMFWFRTTPCMLPVSVRVYVFSLLMRL